MTEPITAHLEFPRFPTHVKVSESQRGRPSVPRYKKINSQFIYSGSPHIRAKVIEQMKLYVTSELQSRFNIEEMRNDFAGKYITIDLTIHAPLNFGTGVKMLKGELKTYPIDAKHTPRWDIGNLGYIWCKVFDDCLTSLGIIPDDNVSVVVRTGGAEYQREDDFEKRKLTFTITAYTPSQWIEYSNTVRAKPSPIPH